MNKTQEKKEKSIYEKLNELCSFTCGEVRERMKHLREIFDEEPESKKESTNGPSNKTR